MTDRLSPRALLAGTACLLFASAGCLNATLTNKLECSSNGKCPSPYQCSANVCVLPSSDAGSVVVTNLDTFDTDLEGFRLNTYGGYETGNLVNSPTNPPQLVWDPSEGDPAPGSLQVTIPFTDYGQLCDVIKTFSSGLQDWTGKTLHVLVKVASGGNPVGTPMPVGIEALADLHPSDGGADGGADTYPYAALYTSISGAGWQEFSFSAATATFTASGWDATKILQFGVQLQTGSPSPLPATKPTTAVVYIDTFTLVSGD
jgi:hypothetical protein